MATTPRALALIVTIGLVGLVGCSSDPAASPSTTPSETSSSEPAPTSSGSPDENMTGGTYPLTEENNGTTVTPAVGQKPFLRLEFTPGAGDQWVVVETPDESIVEIIGDDVVPPAEPMPGAPSDQLWTFEITGEGTTVFKAEKHGPGGDVRATYEITFETVAA